jgi:hypothetical protein
VTQLPRDRRLERGPDPRVRGGLDLDRRRRRAASGPSPAHHAQLQREELVEREPAERRVAGLEARRVVRRLERLADRRQLLAGANLVGQVLRVVAAGGVERRAHRAAEAVRGEPGGEPVDRHDPADVQQVRGVRRLEVRALEHDPALAMLDPARHQELVAGSHALLDEPPAEPRRGREPGAIGQVGGHDLDAPSPRLLDADVHDRDPRRGDRPVVEVAQLREPAELAQVVVPARQVEQQVADGLDPEPPPRPPQPGDRRDAREAHGRGEDRRRVGGDRDGGLRPQRATATRRRGAAAIAHSAEIRYR